MFFVSGITGHVGGAAARQLLKQGRTVRTLARDPQKASAWSKQGVEIIKGDLNDPATLAKALD
ncbi:MAG TPA: NAD(P)H-binding protein, partial [Bryobacteraceae bacterium]|nr:NAD(P)H-binding protein [Bryobacteraceae bacterium]